MKYDKQENVNGTEVSVKNSMCTVMTSDAQKKNIKKNTEIFRFVLIRNTFTLFRIGG